MPIDCKVVDHSCAVLTNVAMCICYLCRDKLALQSVSFLEIWLRDYIIYTYICVCPVERTIWRT